VTWERPVPRTVASSTMTGGAMERIVERGCGLDVHKKSRLAPESDAWPAKTPRGSGAGFRPNSASSAVKSRRPHRRQIHATAPLVLRRLRGAPLSLLTGARSRPLISSSYLPSRFAHSSAS
jgi:hypothetical protein